MQKFPVYGSIPEHSFCMKRILWSEEFPTQLNFLEVALASCGLFGISEDHIEKYQSLDERFIKNPESTFFFKAVGESMSPTINPGEILIVDRSIEQWDRRVCVVQHNGDLLCKRVFLKHDHVYLHSDNPKFSGVKVYEESSSLVWGVVVARMGDVQ